MGPCGWNPHRGGSRSRVRRRGTDPRRRFQDRPRTGGRGDPLPRAAPAVFRRGLARHGSPGIGRTIQGVEVAMSLLLASAFALVLVQSSASPADTEELMRLERVWNQPHGKGDVKRLGEFWAAEIERG